MSVKANPASGYVVEAIKYLRFLTVPETAIEAALKGDEFAGDALQKLADRYGSGRGFPELGDPAFILGDNDDAGELEHDTWYFSFVKEDLFVLTPTPLMAALKKAKLEPELQAWTTWG